MDLNKIKTVAVVGFKRSAISVCDCLLSLGKKVKVSEGGEFTDCYRRIAELYRAKGVIFENGGHSSSFFHGCDLAVLSPGVNPVSSSAAACLRELNIPFIGEIEFASILNKARIIAITGTNGKTTTTFLAYRVLKSFYPRTYLAGNIGIPFSSLALKTKADDLVVLELSSFQLETIRDFCPYLACLTNLEPDHLDRYLDFAEYCAAKKNIFRNQSDRDYALLNRSFSGDNGWVGKLKAKVVWFDREFANENFSAVFRMASVLGVPEPVIRDVFSRFQGLPHRMQRVAVINGISFINDSKATNPASTAWALKNLSSPVILIAGGRDKGVAYTPLLPYLEKIKKINLFGEAADKINSFLSGQGKKADVFSDLKAAVEASFREAKPGETVLLSPMCSSYDMFSDYIQRGRCFTEIVKKIRENNE